MSIYSSRTTKKVQASRNIDFNFYKQNTILDFPKTIMHPASVVSYRAVNCKAIVIIIQNLKDYVITDERYFTENTDIKVIYVIKYACSFQLSNVVMTSRYFLLRSMVYLLSSPVKNMEI